MSDIITITDKNTGTEWILNGFVTERGMTPEQHTIVLTTAVNVQSTEFDLIEMEADGTTSYLSETGEMVTFPFNVWTQCANDDESEEESESAEDGGGYSEVTEDELSEIQDRADIVLTGDDLEIISGDDFESDDATDNTVIGGNIHEGYPNVAADDKLITDDMAEESEAEPAASESADSHETERLTMEDVIEEIRAAVIDEAKAAATQTAQEEFNRLQEANNAFVRIQSEASSELDPNAAKLLDMMLESFSGMVTQRSVRRGEASRNILAVMVAEFSRAKGSPLRTGNVSPRIIDNPDLWEVNHMIEIGKAIVAEFIHDYAQFSRQSVEFNAMAQRVAESSARETNLASELRAERAHNLRLMQTGNNSGDTGTSQIIEGLQTQVANLRKQLAKNQAMPAKAKFLIFDPNRGYAFANQATGRTWWNHDLISDPEALCQFPDAPTAVRAATLLRTAAVNKDTLAYVVRLEILKAVEEPVIATGKFRGAAGTVATPPELIESLGEVVDDGDLNILADPKPDDEDVIADDENEMIGERDFSEGVEVDDETVEDDAEEEPEPAPVRTAKPAPGKVSNVKPKPSVKNAPKPAPGGKLGKLAPKKLGAAFRVGRNR